jgi:hypothetical protein
MGAPTSQNNINKLAAWNACEGNAPGQSGLPINNPFNTTLNCCGGVSVNSAGVKAYPSWNAGMQATVITIQGTPYTLILTNLRNDGGTAAFAAAVGASPWGTSGTCIASRIGVGLAPLSTPAPTTQTQFNYAQLEGIWIQAGGNPQYAAIAAAIATAESSGNSQASNTNSNGSVDRGLWQINSSNGAGSSFDIMTNARTAVSMSNNGVNWRPWCTAYSDGACGTKGGCYQCPGSPYLRYLQSNVPPDLNVPLNGTNANTPGANPPQSATYQSCSVTQWVTTGPECFFGFIAGQAGNAAGAVALATVKLLIATVLNPIMQLIAGGLGMIAGVNLMVLGIFLILEQTKTGRAVTRTAIAGGALAVGQPEVAAAAGAPRIISGPIQARVSQQRFAQRSGIIEARYISQQRASAVRQALGQEAMVRRTAAQEQIRTEAQRERLRATTEEQLRRESAMYTQRAERGRRGIPRSTYPGPKGRR